MDIDRIGNYQVLHKLGDGATSSVFLAYDPAADRQVAVKVVHPQVLKDPDRGRLHRRLLANEAALAGKLVHPHIVQIYDALVSEDQGYIVMEYVPGGTLEQFCAAERLLPLERLAEIVFKCARALDYAYRMGITHRDIKPANILLVSPDGGDVKISDFGSALRTADQTQTQVSGVGSPAYMSPQQVREMPLTHQTDIYSLGVVMYQLLTGRLPFPATNNFGMIYQICHAEPPPPSAFRAEVTPELSAIVARAMAKELDDRYPDWEAFAHDLAKTIRHKKLSSRQEDFSDSAKFDTLRALPFFAEFADVEIWETVRFSRWEDVTPETLVMQDGEPGDSFCFLIEGELRVSKRGRILSLLSPGECFGEMAVIGRSGHMRGADVFAQTAAKVVTITGTALRNASDACRMHFYQSFLEVLAGRLTTANDRLSAT